MSGGFKLLALGGDGIGPEVLNAALQVLLEALAKDAKLRFDGRRRPAARRRLGALWHLLPGGDCWPPQRPPMPSWWAPWAGRKWDAISVPGGPEMQDGLMRLRHDLDSYAGLQTRPRAWPALEPT